MFVLSNRNRELKKKKKKNGIRFELVAKINNKKLDFYIYIKEIKRIYT